MRALKWAIGVMSVLIVAGVAVIGVTIVRRLSALPGPTMARVLDEPAGSRIAGIASVPEGMALLLQGGGPDRVVVIDAKSGRSAVWVTLPTDRVPPN
jgi:hypothetical protein